MDEGPNWTKWLDGYAFDYEEYQLDENPTEIYTTEKQKVHNEKNISDLFFKNENSETKASQKDYSHLTESQTCLEESVLSPPSILLDQP